MSKLVHIVILFLIGGIAIVQGEEWLSPQTYDNDIGSYFTDPLFYPWNSQAERTLYESQYYPYFGEDFFRTNINPNYYSQEGIATQRQIFESVTGGLKMLNSGGLKLSICQSLTSRLRGCVDVGPGGIPHAARFIQQRIEHQRDRQKNRTQSWNGEEIPSFSSSACTPEKIKEAQ
jgi:hypothetical protein